MPTWKPVKLSGFVVAIRNFLKETPMRKESQTYGPHTLNSEHTERIWIYVSSFKIKKASTI